VPNLLLRLILLSLVAWWVIILFAYMLGAVVLAALR
jgi:hypothetical protein